MNKRGELKKSSSKKKKTGPPYPRVKDYITHTATGYKGNPTSVLNILRHCGGAVRIAQKLGITKGAVYQWLTNGIPFGHVPILMLLSEDVVTWDGVMNANRKVDEENL